MCEGPGFPRQEQAGEVMPRLRNLTGNQAEGPGTRISPDLHVQEKRLSCWCVPWYRTGLETWLWVLVKAAVAGAVMAACGSCPTPAVAQGSQSASSEGDGGCATHAGHVLHWARYVSCVQVVTGRGGVAKRVSPTRGRGDGALGVAQVACSCTGGIVWVLLHTVWPWWCVVLVRVCCVHSVCYRVLYMPVLPQDSS